jgi:hypothetical protein
MLTNSHFNKPGKFVGFTFHNTLSTLANCEGLPDLLNVIDEDISNLTPDQQKELLLYWIQCLGHANIQCLNSNDAELPSVLQMLAASDVVPNS